MGHRITSSVCAGDCRAVLVRAGRAQQLTRAHTADDAAERERLQREHPGVLRHLAQGWRVGEVGLQVTRCALPPWLH